MPSVARLVLLAPLLAITPAAAEEECVKVAVELTPSDSLQIVAWVEHVDGTFIDTIYMTAKTGFYGLGNRPGRMDFNSGPIPNGAGIDDMWPYGRRVGTFPVWAHRHGMTWPAVVFQDGAENNLSHSQGQSSVEAFPPYCRPIAPTDNADCGGFGGDKMMWDTGTCASERATYTDKGRLSPTVTSLYPPRADVTRQSVDHADVDLFADLNPFDAITRATPKGGEPVAINWAVPRGVPAGDYVLYVETSKSFDFNDVYTPAANPAPQVSYSGCGMPYRGQPSVVYSVPFKVSSQPNVAMSSSYIGYGDVNGETGTLHPPDGTIVTNTPGSGALRLQLVSDNGNMYRVRLSAIPQIDYAIPGMPTELETMGVEATTATLRFVESGDDGLVGPVSNYEVRVRANDEITEDNFDSSTPVLTTMVTPIQPGELATLELKSLLPETNYSVAIRAVDDCYKSSPIIVTRFTTGERVVGSVDACFIATAAYGSIMANDVEVLRSFRDSLLARSILGELAIETYYTFGPAMAGLIGESDVLRATARAAIAPVVERVRKLDL